MAEEDGRMAGDAGHPKRVRPVRNNRANGAPDMTPREPGKKRSTLWRGFYLTRLMMMEEYRHHTSYSNKWGFILFPVMMFIFFFVISVYQTDLFASMPYERAVLMLHGSTFFYGMSMGAFAFFGREFLERRHGRRNYLITTPVLLPLRFREAVAAYYVHDVIFYMGLALTPFALGLTAAQPFLAEPLAWASIGKTVAATCLSFCVGISFSFFMSSLYMRSIPVFIAVVTAVGAGVAWAFFGPWGDIGYVLPGWRIQVSPGPAPVALGLGYFLFFSWTASRLVVESAEVRSSQTGRVKETFAKKFDRWKWMGVYGPLVNKELADIRRSRMIPRIAFSFILPLFMISLFSWIVNRGVGLDVEFNSIFYGSMVGFFGMLIYTWLNNTDEPDFYDYLPVNVPQVIKAKLLVWFMVTSGISTIFVAGLAIFLGELALLPIALFVMLTTSIYVVTATAYLTGLRPHTALFNFWVMARFNILAFIPLISVFMMSMTINIKGATFGSLIALLTVGLIILVSTYVLILGINEKWRDETFSR